jgi:hypothetical protein
MAERAVVELREITFETVRAICRLGVAPSQADFVAPNAVSIAEALPRRRGSGPSTPTASRSAS